MAWSKITGNQAILGGGVILTAPKIYAAGSYNLLTTASTGTMTIYGVPNIENTTTDATLGGIKLGGCTQYIAQIAMAANYLNSGTTNVKTSALTLPVGAIVEDVWVDCVTAATSATDTFTVGINSGTSDITPLLAAVIPTSAHAPGVETYRAAGGGKLVAETTTYWYRVPYHTATATGRNIVFTRSATVFSATYVANTYIKYVVPE